MAYSVCFRMNKRTVFRAIPQSKMFLGGFPFSSTVSKDLLLHLFLLNYNFKFQARGQFLSSVGTVVAQNSSSNPRECSLWPEKAQFCKDPTLPLQVSVYRVKPRFKKKHTITQNEKICTILNPSSAILVGT